MYVHICMYVWCVDGCVSVLQPVPSFSFGSMPLPTLKTMTSDLQVTLGIFILFVAQTHIISGNVAGILHVNPLQLASLHLTVLPFVANFLHNSLCVCVCVCACAFHLGRRKCNLLCPKCDVIFDSKNCRNLRNISKASFKICEIV